MNRKFNPQKLEKLNSPNRLENIPPDYIWGKLKISECKTIVDIGAGTGLFSKAFCDLMKNGKVYALDISDVMINWIEENLSSYNKEIIPMLMSENKAPLANEISDLVLMITLHHELNDPISILTEAHRILKKDGKICIVDWKKEEMLNGPPLEIRCSPNTISNQLKISGFKKIQIDTTLNMFNIVWAKK